MKSRINAGLVLGLVGSMLAACGGGSQDTLNASQKTISRSTKASATACYPAWVSATAYVGGATVSYGPYAGHSA